MVSKLFFLACALPIASAAETILGAYIIARHGDRTAKAILPYGLTTLGYSDVFTEGNYFRNRYIASNAKSRIAGISADAAKLTQISAFAPLNFILHSSALGFLQGLYPPITTIETLRNGTKVEAPLGGYQLIPVVTMAGAENTGWLQGAGGCANAISSSNGYFSSQEYNDLHTSTLDFYKKLAPAVSGVFSGDQISYREAYSIWDILRVASVHNVSNTFTAAEVYPDDVALQARLLADRHEWGLAYNVSEPIRSVAGAVLAGQVVTDLNKVITSQGKSKLIIQFNAYANFMAFFGVANLNAANTDFMGVPEYASTMTFELFTTEPASPFPSADKINVRFLFHNGTATNVSEPIAFPLFGGSATSLSWKDFSAGMNKFAIADQPSWCKACGNSTGICSSDKSSSTSPSTDNSGSTSGVSSAVAGVIGAMVTLAVVLGVLALVLCVGGFRLSKKGRRSKASVGSVGSGSIEEGKFGH